MGSGSRLFFVGAGASRNAGLPITSELWHGLSFTLCEVGYARGFDKGPLHRLYRFLKHVYAIREQELEQSASFWTRRFKAGDVNAVAPVFDPPLPAVTELLATIDVLLSEGSVLAVRPDGHNFNIREIGRIRDQVVRTLGYAFRGLNVAASKMSPLLSVIRPHDAIVTTNWDLLLDEALDRACGTDSSDCGTDVIIVSSHKRTPRPPLLKLHGSFNWLVCNRCTRLYVNPTLPISTLPEDADLAGDIHESVTPGEESRCDCGIVLSPLLIAPTYLKDYRNRHLGNIWAHALKALAAADEWNFIGYSLPEDDFHIRVLLQKAAHMRNSPPRISVVNPDSTVEGRFRGLLRRRADFLPTMSGVDELVRSLRA